MQEFFPLACGLVLGLILGFVRPRIRLRVGVVCSVLLGVLATVVSGEFRASWAYLLVDIPLVAAASFVGVVVAARGLSPARLRS